MKYSLVNSSTMEIIKAIDLPFRPVGGDIIIDKEANLMYTVSRNDMLVYDMESETLTITVVAVTLPSTFNPT